MSLHSLVLADHRGICKVGIILTKCIFLRAHTIRPEMNICPEILGAFHSATSDTMAVQFI